MTPTHCPACGSPATNVGMRALRPSFACQSYRYHDWPGLYHQSQLCSALEELRALKANNADLLAQIEHLTREVARLTEDAK